MRASVEDGVVAEDGQQDGKISEMIVTEAWILSDWRMRSAVVSPSTPAPMTTTCCLAGEDIFLTECASLFESCVESSIDPQLRFK